MSFRFHRGIRLLPGLRLNLSKTGPSLSLGKRGLSLNLSPSGVRTTVGIPGSGMSYRSPTFKWGSVPSSARGGASPIRSTTPRGRKEKLRTILPDPTRYPQIDEECERLMTEQPSNWEWLLAYRLMTLRFTVVRQDWENVTGARETPRHPHGIRDVLSWNRKQLDNLQGIVNRISGFGEERVTNEAFGPPGVKGNPEKIVAWVDSICGDLAACVDWERETQTLRWYPEGGQLLAAMNGWTLCILKPFFEMLASLEKQLAVVEQTKRLDLYVKIDGFDGDKAVKVLEKMPNRVWSPFPENGEAKVDTGGPSGIEPPSLEFGGGGGGDGEKGPKVFFDDGQVRVTEHLVTIGPPWNKAFAVSEIRSVTHGANKENSIFRGPMRTLGWLFIALGILSGVAGVWVGVAFCLFMGVGLIFPNFKKEIPYSVNICTGGFWETEYLSSKSLAWCEAVAAAVQQAIAYKPEPPSNDGGQFIPGPQSRLRN